MLKIIVLGEFYRYSSVGPIVLPRERHPAFDMKSHESTGYSLVTATLSYFSPLSPTLLPRILYDSCSTLY